MNTKPTLFPSIFIGLMAGILTAMAGSIIIFCLLVPAANETATLLNIFHYVWRDGFVSPSCGYDLACRLSNLGTVLSDSTIRLHLKLLCVATTVSTVIAFLIMDWDAPLREVVLIAIGSKVLYGRDARRSLRKHIRRTGSVDPSALWLMPHVQLTIEAEASNISLLGTHGSGKTGVLRGWAEQVIERGDRCVIHDAKGDFTAGLPVDDFLLLAPRDMRGWIWAIGRDVVDKEAAREVAAKLVPKATTGEAVWTDSARAVLAGVIEVLQHRERQADGVTWGWPQLFHMVFLPPLALRAELLNIGSAVASIIDIDEDGRLSRSSQSILLTLWIAALTNIRPLADVASATPKDRHFSINEWLSPQSGLPKTIVLQHAADYPELTSTISGLFVEVLAGRLLAVSTPTRNTPWVYLILDELSTLKRLDRLPGLLNVGREKGVRCIAATQDWEQIIKVYGREDAATLEARFTIKAVCKLGISETRDRVIDKFAGRRDIVEWEDAGQGNPKVRRIRTVAVLEPQQLSNELGVVGKSKNLRVRLAIFGLGDIAMVDIPFTSWPARRPAHAPISPA